MSNILDDLNAQQRKAVEYLDGPLLVFAGPGTGKTRVTTRKLAYLVKEKGYRPEEVLALTFSQKAAGEMEGRVRELIPDTAGLKISTFHSFCLDIVRESSLELGMNSGGEVFTEEFQQAFFLDNMDRLGIGTLRIPSRPTELAKQLQGAITRLKQENISVDRLERYLDEDGGGDEEERGALMDLAGAYRAYEEFKRENSLLDFGDMQFLTLRLLEKSPTALKRYRDRFRHIIVDEFQDTDYIQLRILLALAHDGNITVVGDDDQSIYRFRGAYLTNVHEFNEFFRSGANAPERVVLDTNYRCTGNIQKAATGLIVNNPDREPKDIDTDRDDGTPVSLRRYDTDRDQATAILSEATRLHMENGVSWGDMAVLVRRRVDARPIVEAFERAGIPLEVIGSRRYFREPVIRAVWSYLRVLEDPNLNQPSLGHILQRPVHGVAPGDVQELTRYARNRDLTLWKALGDLDGYTGEKEQLQGVRAELDALMSTRREGGLPETVRAVLFGRDLFRVEMARNNAGNIRLLNRFMALTHQFMDIYPEAGLEEFMGHLRAFADLGLEDEDQGTGGDRVHLMTIHGAKGMEFPVVFLPTLNADRMPTKYRPHRLSIPDGLADGVLPEGTPEELHLQEERRLMYVGMSRAKERLFLSYCERFGDNKNPTQPSRFLAEVLSTGDSVESAEVTGTLEGPPEASKTAGEAIVREMNTAIAREDWQGAVDATVALAISRGMDVSGLTLRPDLDVEEYVKDLNIISTVPEREHASEARYSPSKLGAYEECPQRYRFSYVLGIPGEPRTFFDLGTVVHDVLERVGTLIMEGNEVSEAEAVALLDSLWVPSRWDSREKERQDRQDAGEMIRKFLVRQAERKGRIVGLETKIEVDLDGRTMVSKVDRIDEVDGALAVIDYKTGSTVKYRPELKKDFQMGMYKMAVERATGKPVCQVGHWQLRKDREYMVELSDEELESIRSRALEVIESIEAGKFPPTPGYRTCMFCDYKMLCDHCEGSS